jgi:hypothetical protein
MVDRFQWQRIIEDLARHLGSALDSEQAGRILDEAERDLARLGTPVDFWRDLESQYHTVTRRLEELGNHGARESSATVRALIAARRLR